VYLKYFGFREAPFNLTPDPKFFFDSPFQREAWAALVYGINQRKGFVVVTGEVGTGKTTLIRKVLRSLESTHHSVFIFNTRLTFDELLETILRDLELDQSGSGRVVMLERLNEFLLEKARVGQVVSIIIDEAQNLTEDALEGLRLLSNMETDREKLLQNILVGQPELDVKLSNHSLRQLKQRVSLWCHLACLSQSEAEAYIRHRLQVAQYQGPDIFPGPTVRAIWEYTSGIPRLINAVCDNALLTAFATSEKVVSVDMIQEVVRDLKVQPEFQRVEPFVPERADLRQPRRASAGGVTEFRDGVAVKVSRRPEDEERPGFGRTAATTTAQKWVPTPPEREPEGVEIAARELREVKRQQARPLAGVAAVREKKSADNARVLDIGEISRLSRPISVKADAFAGPSRKFDDGRDGMMLPPIFFDKMVAALIEAMGPMAPCVIKGQAAALGESLERFPMLRLRDLMQGIKKEILSETLRTAFEKQIAKEIAEHMPRLPAGPMAPGQLVPAS
jgi:general secretion pathway protein A